MELTLQKFKNNGRKCNIEKSSFGQTKIEYLEFWVTITGIRPINKKVESIVNMTPPKNTREVHAFLGLLNYYRDMWAIRSHLLNPLTSLKSPKVKFKWNDVEQKLFDDIKCTVYHENLLAYPDFNKRFYIHTDSSD